MIFSLGFFTFNNIVNSQEECFDDCCDCNDCPTCFSRPTATPVAIETPMFAPTATPIATKTPDGDVCENIDGIQTSVPEGKHIDASGKNCVEFSVPGVDNGSDVGGSNVLGASTMARTGVIEDSIFYSMFTLGSLLSSFGIMRNNAKVKSPRLPDGQENSKV